MNPTPSIEHWRIGISQLARWACGYGSIGKLEPIYIEVTEGRDGPSAWKRYSSCADLAHFIAKRCGVRQTWVNRTDDDFAGDWVSGLNVSKLVKPSVEPGPDYEAGLGDIWIVSNTWPQGRDAHVCVCLGPDPEQPDEISTANYGAAGLQNLESPGGKIASHRLRRDAGGWRYGQKQLVRVLDVPNLVARVSVKPDFSGPERWSAEWTGEVKDALEASVSARLIS
jgi:hypothetical protein